MTGWALKDDITQDTLPPMTLEAGQFLVVAARGTSFRERYPGFSGALVSLESFIGNGLGNAGDRVILLDDRGEAVDAISYGSDTTRFDPACPRVAEGQSLSRRIPQRDTDTAADWEPQISPDPGAGAMPSPSPTPSPTATWTDTPTPTVMPPPTITPTYTPTATITVTASPVAAPTPTASASPTVTFSPSPTPAVSPAATDTAMPTATLTPSPTSTATLGASPPPSATDVSSPTVTATWTPTPVPIASPTITGIPVIRLNEFLPAPDRVDWNGDGVMDYDDEWVEIVSLENVMIDLGGWMLDDLADGGSRPYVFAAGTLLPPGSFLLRFRATTKVALNQDGDTVRLIAPDGVEVDRREYRNPKPDGSFSRMVDGIGDWTDAYPPSPGGPNRPAAMPTPTRLPAATHTATPTATSLPSTAWPGAVVITEIMVNPKIVEDAHGEWFEIYNTGDAALALNGWTIRDLGSDRHLIQANAPLWLPARGYLVLGRDAVLATNGGAPVAYRYSNFSLGNTGDEIVLEDGVGREIDRVAYSAALGFPSPNGASLALISPDRNNASAVNWRVSLTTWPGSAGDLGSPGAANPVPLAQIEGHVFQDLNSNGHRDRGEPGIVGVQMRLNTGAIAHTDGNGWYGFYGLAARSYLVTESQPAGYTSITPDALTITVAWGEISLGHDFGDRRLPTPTPSPSPTGTPAAWPKLLLSEVFYDAPQAGIDSDFEWVEIVNAGLAPVDLDGWVLRDNSTQDRLPAFTLRPGEYLAIAATAAGFAANYPGFTGHLVSLEGSIGGGLGNSGDHITLFAPDGTPVDAMSYGADTDAFDPACPNVAAGQSLARVPATQDTDRAADWVIQPAPNPGAPGSVVIVTATPTPSVTVIPSRTPEPTRTRTPTITPTSTVTSSPTPTTTPTTALTPTVTPMPTVTATPTAIHYDHAALRLNEVLPYPSGMDWNGDGEMNADDEWVEIVNCGLAPISLAGWALDDAPDAGRAAYFFPADATLGPGAFLLRFRSQTGVALNNDGDTVQLLGPDSAVVDSFSFVNPRPNRSYSRSHDGDGAWTDAYPPSPGSANRPPSPTPTATPTATATPFPAGIILNEILPEPKAVDWDADGTVSYDDEWIELYNSGMASANLGGWAVADETRPFTLPLGTVIWPQSYLLLFRAQTHLALGDNRDTVTLLRPDGSTADRFAYTQGAGPDGCYCRYGDGAWVRGCQPSPGAANRSGASPTAAPPDDDADPDSRPDNAVPTAVQLSIAAARAAPTDTFVTVIGVVTMSPGLLTRRIYLEDESGGICVYLRRGDFPQVALGDRLQATGWTSDYHGEMEIEISSASRLRLSGAGELPDPPRLRTGDVGEAHEGRLVWVIGRPVGFARDSVSLDDGSGPVPVYFPEGLSWRRPYVQLDEFWAAQGVIGQYVNQPPYIGGYRLIPRLATDFSRPPPFLPVTGVGGD